MTKIILFSLLSFQVLADTQILPKNTRAFIYKHYNASVPGTFSNDGIQKDFRIRETLGTQVIKGISTSVSKAYDKLYNVAPKVATDLNLGKINFDPAIDVNANVFGLAWGLTDHLMLVAGLPLMNATVQVRGGYINDGSIKAAAKKLRAMHFDDEETRQTADGLAQVLDELPTIKGEHLQNAIVNSFGYKPVGDWSATDLGDARIYLQNKFVNGERYKAGARLGVVVPTGRVDDPDNLTDIAFGTGYYSTFVESLNDFPLIGEALVLSINAKYQYNWNALKTYRLVVDRSFPLTAAKENINYKPGNMWRASAELTSKLWRNFEAVITYASENKWVDSISGSQSKYNYGLLEDQTDYLAHTLEFSWSYSTVNAYFQKKFWFPMKVGLTYSFLLSGYNTEDIRLLGLHVQAYF